MGLRVPKDGISVVVPTYNGGRHLLATLSAIAQQSLTPAAIIVVDDASTDDTVERVEEFRARTTVPIVVVLRPANSGGPSAPIVDGIERCETALVAVCEQDDLMFPGKLAAVVACFSGSADLGLVISRYQVLRADDVALKTVVADDGYSEFGALDTERRNEAGCHLVRRDSAYRTALRKNYAVSFSNMSFRLGEWRRVRPLDIELKRAADHGVLLRMASDSRVAWIDEVLWRFHRHGSSAVQTTAWETWATDYRRIWSREARAQRGGPFAQAATRKYSGALGDCCYEYRRRGQFRQALRCCRERVTRQPWAVGAWVDLMKLAVSSVAAGVSGVKGTD